MILYPKIMHFSQCFRETQDRRLSVYLLRDIYFKELAHVICETVKSKVSREDWQGGTQERADVAT